MSKQIPLQRIKWIDLTKGVAIFLMVCGHTGIPSLISNWICLSICRYSSSFPECYFAQLNILTYKSSFIEEYRL